MTQSAVSRYVLQRISIAAEATQAWLEAALKLRYPDPCNLPSWRDFVDASVALAHQHLPASAIAVLGDFFRPDGPDALVFENLPVDPDLPSSPSDGRRPGTKSTVSEAVIAGLIEGHAAILAYSNEKNGAPIHEIAPAVGQENVPSSSGRVPFPCHTDVAFLAPTFSPRGLLLFGLRNQSGAPTSIVPLDSVLEAASASLISSLAKPIFRHPAPATFELGLSVIAPILRRDEGAAARIAVQTHAVQPCNEEARAAIAELRRILTSIETENVVVGPATALLFKNDRVLHGRSAFRGERWLQRAYFTASLEPFRQATGSPAGEFAFDARQLLSSSAQEKIVAPSDTIRHSKN